MLGHLLPNDKMLKWSNLKAFADDKINITVKIKNYFGKGLKYRFISIKYWLPAFSLVPQCF